MFVNSFNCQSHIFFIVLFFIVFIVYGIIFTHTKKDEFSMTMYMGMNIRLIMVEIVVT